MALVNELIKSLESHSDSIEFIDLTTRLSARTPALRLPEPFLNLIDFSIQNVSAYNEPGPFWRHNNIHTGEHIGTHVDAPIHWVSGKNGKDVSQIEPHRLIAPAVVIDKTAEVRSNPDFLLSRKDIEKWQDEHGKIAQGSWLLVRTGWSQYGDDRTKFLNADENGPHSPGIDAQTAKWIAEELPVTGVGVETVGIDAGAAGGFDPPFPMHYHLLGHDKYGLTSLRNLDRLPARGALLVVAPLPIVGGTGSPSRVFALLDK